MLIIIALKEHASPADAELIGVVVTIAGTGSARRTSPADNTHVHQDDAETGSPQ